LGKSRVVLLLRARRRVRRSLPRLRSHLPEHCGIRRRCIRLSCAAVDAVMRRIRQPRVALNALSHDRLEYRGVWRKPQLPEATSGPSAVGFK
jgi:hypothetical protein